MKLGFDAWLNIISTFLWAKPKLKVQFLLPAPRRKSFILVSSLPWHNIRMSSFSYPLPKGKTSTVARRQKLPPIGSFQHLSRRFNSFSSRLFR